MCLLTRICRRVGHVMVCSGSSLVSACDDTVLRVGSVGQNCDEVCASVGAGYVCDREATSGVNSHNVFAQLNLVFDRECPDGVVREYAPAGSIGFRTDNCEGQGWEGNVPFYSGNPRQCFYCADTTKTLCSAKHYDRERICGCSKCPAGSYSAAVAAGSANACMNCPSDSSSPAGSVAAAACKCSAVSAAGVGVCCQRWSLCRCVCARNQSYGRDS